MSPLCLVIGFSISCSVLLVSADLLANPSVLVDTYCEARDYQVTAFADCLTELLPEEMQTMHKECFEQVYGGGTTMSPLFERDSVCDGEGKDKLVKVAECMGPTPVKVNEDFENNLEDIQKCVNLLHAEAAE